MESVPQFLMYSGVLFQSLGAHAKKARSPYLSDCESQGQPSATCLPKTAKCGKGYAAPAAPPSKQALSRAARDTSAAVS